MFPRRNRSGAGSRDGTLRSQSRVQARARECHRCRHRLRARRVLVRAAAGASCRVARRIGGRPRRAATHLPAVCGLSVRRHTDQQHHRPRERIRGGHLRPERGSPAGCLRERRAEARRLSQAGSESDRGTDLLRPPERAHEDLLGDAVESREHQKVGQSRNADRQDLVSVSVFENLFADVRYALRWLRRSPGFTLIAIASLAIGIGFNTTLFTLVDALLFRPLPVERPDELVDVFTTGGDGDTYATTSYPDFLGFKSQNQVFSDMLAYSPSIAAVKLTDRSRLAMGEVVTGNYFQLFGVKPRIGRTLVPADDQPGAPRVAVISYRAWNREYGASPSVSGQAIRIHGRPYTIVGVLPPEFIGMVPLIAPEVWTPMAYVDDVEPGGIISNVPSPTGNTRLERRGMRWMFVKGRLKPGATVDHAAANLRLIGNQLQTSYLQTNKDRDVAVVPTKDVHIHPVADRALLPIAVSLMVVVGLVLLIACANVASMLLARASGRQKEIGIRLAIGASRMRLMQQLLSESAVMATLGAAAGVALAWTLTRLAMSIQLPIPIPLSFALRIDSRVLIFTAGATFIAAMVAGPPPALKATRPNLVAELKGDGNASRAAQAGGRRWTLRDGLVVTQIAVTMVLLVPAGLLTRSLMAAQQ